MHSQRHAEQSPGNPRQYRLERSHWPAVARGSDCGRRRTRSSSSNGAASATTCARASAAGTSACSPTQPRVTGIVSCCRTGGGRRTRRRGSNPRRSTAPRIVDAGAFRWPVGWPGRRWEELVLYELHVGTFTSAVRSTRPDRLDHLAGRA